MITPQEFVTRWRGEPLVRPRQADLDRADIPEPSKRFLEQVGLPDLALSFLDFSGLANGIPLLSQVAEFKGDRYHVLGTAHGDNYLCVGEAGDGEMVFFCASREHPMVLINSSVPQFTECLLAYQDYEEGLFEDTPFEMIELLAEALADRVQQIDPRAMGDEEHHFWPYFVFGLAI